MIDRVRTNLEAVARVIEEVATGNTIARLGDAGDDLACLFCNGEEPWPRVAQDPFSGEPFKHEDTCIVLLCRHIMEIPDEMAVFQQETAPEDADHHHEWRAIPGRYPTEPLSQLAGLPWPWKRDYCTLCYLIWEHP